MTPHGEVKSPGVPVRHRRPADRTGTSPFYWLTTVRADGRPDVTPLIAVAEDDAFEAKYGSVWHLEVGDGGFGTGADVAGVFRIEPAKVLAFAKQPYGRTPTGSPDADAVERRDIAP